MKYTIGFRSGKNLQIDVQDGKQFVLDIMAGIQTNPSAPCQWYASPGILIAVSEVEFVMPSDAILN